MCRANEFNSLNVSFRSYSREGAMGEPDAAADPIISRAIEFLGGAAAFSTSTSTSRSNETSGDDAFPSLAGAHNKATCARLCDLVRDRGATCVCVEGPDMSGKSLCCELAFREVGCQVVRWNVKDASEKAHVSVDTCFRADTESSIEVILVDNLHALLAEDKNSFQALLKTERAVESLRRKTKGRTRIVVMLNNDKLDARLRTRLHRCCRSSEDVLTVSHPEHEETKIFVETVIGKCHFRAPCYAEGVRRAVLSILSDDTRKEDERHVSTCRQTTRRNKKNDDSRDTTPFGLLRWSVPEEASRARSISDALVAACIFSAYSDSHGTLSRSDVALPIIDLAKRYASR